MMLLILFLAMADLCNNIVLKFIKMKIIVCVCGIEEIAQ
jgi:hypothetical protein